MTPQVFFSLTMISMMFFLAMSMLIVMAFFVATAFFITPTRFVFFVPSFFVPSAFLVLMDLSLQMLHSLSNGVSKILLANTSEQFVCLCHATDAFHNLAMWLFVVSVTLSGNPFELISEFHELDPSFLGAKPFASRRFPIFFGLLSRS